MNVTLSSDLIYSIIVLRNTSLFLSYLLRTTFIHVFHTSWSLFILRIYSFMYWKSGTSDHLVLILFVLQCTDYQRFFLILPLTTILIHPILVKFYTHRQSHFILVIYKSEHLYYRSSVRFFDKTFIGVVTALSIDGVTVHPCSKVIRLFCNVKQWHLFSMYRFEILFKSKQTFCNVK